MDCKALKANWDNVKLRLMIIELIDLLTLETGQGR